MLGNGYMNERARAMQNSTLTDELVMSLVEQALALAQEERQAFLERVCSHDAELLRTVCQYVRSEEQMGSFLKAPFLEPAGYDQPFEPGQLLIGRFRVLREVARGGMGIVWDAFDEKLDRRVAIKCAKTGFGEQLPPEVRNASEISHTNVCKIFEIHTAQSAQGPVDFISMEYVDGETLAQRLSKGPLSKKECLRVALQLCAGLAEAHRNNVIHGDLKTKNIILTTGPDHLTRGVIMDFGLARRLDAAEVLTGEENLAGTPSYMAPELWKGTKPSVTSDIYALGVVMWEMLSGRVPSDLGVTSATLAWGDRSAWKPPTGFGKWDRVIACCLKADPLSRFQHVDDVARALGPSQTKIWLLRGALAAMLAIAAGAGVYLWGNQPSERVRLALLPFHYYGNHPSVATRVYQDSARQLKELKRGKNTEVSLVPIDKILRSKAASPAEARDRLDANYVLRATIVEQSGQFAVHAYLTNAQTGADEKEWQEEYRPHELRYLPAALAALVTRKFDLPVKEQHVNAAASTDYEKGVAALRFDSRVDSALASFSRAIAEDGDSALPYAGLAEAQWFKYDADNQVLWLAKMQDSVRRARLRSPDVAQVHYIEGILQAQEGRYEQAVDEYKRATELMPLYGDAYRRLGDAYESNNQLDYALSSCRKAVEIEPGRYRNQLRLGSYFYERASYERALEYYQAAEKLAPDEKSVQFDLGNVLTSLGRFVEAEQELHRMPHWRETPIFLHSLGLICLYQRREQEAIPLIQMALQRGPEEPLWWMNLGTAYRRLKRVSEANNAFSRGVQLAETEIAKNSRDEAARAHLAYMCNQLGQRSRAYSDIKQALQQSPNDADVRWMGVVTLESLASREEALTVLGASPAGVIADLGRWPDMADLSRDSRFLLLSGSRGEK